MAVSRASQHSRARRVAPVRPTPAEAALSREHIHPTALNERVSLARCTLVACCSLAAPRAVLHPPTDFRPRPLQYRAPAPFPDFVALGGASSRFPGNNVWVERLILAGKKRKRV